MQDHHHHRHQDRGVLDAPSAELVEENLTTTVSVAFIPLSFGITHVKAPFLEQRDSFSKFFHADSAVVRGINLIEGDPELIVLANVLE